MSLLKIVMVRWEIGSFGFALVSACAVGGKGKCANAGWLKLKKMCGGEKIKNTEGSAMSDGLLVVQLQYGLYVFGQVSMFVNAFQFIFCRSACPKNGRLTIGYNM